jgi:putative membrane protein
MIEMNRTTSTLLSLGVSAVLIAVGVWLLYNHSLGIWPEFGQRAWGHHGMMAGDMGIVMIIFWVVLIAAVTLLISGLINGIRDGKTPGLAASRALEILKERYARGEIDKAEYEVRRRDLTR